MTLAPTPASAATKRRWFCGKAGSTKTMFIPITVVKALQIRRSREGARSAVRRRLHPVTLARLAGFRDGRCATSSTTGVGQILRSGPGPVAWEPMLSYERSGPTTSTPLLLVHAGIADRRMWDPIWPALTADHDVVRVDLRGFGESSERPSGAWSPRSDVLEVLDHLGIDRVHLVGCSFGAGVCAELALERAGPGRLPGAGRTGRRADHREDRRAGRGLGLEGQAIDAGDLDAAVEANVTAWVDGPHRGPDVVPAAVRDAVRTMQRRNFDLTHDWPDEVWEADDELDPEAHERLAEITAPTLVISGELDIDSIRIAADHLLAGLPDARAVVWPDVAHLPSMERPDDFAAEVLDWVFPRRPVIEARPAGQTSAVVG